MKSPSIILIGLPSPALSVAVDAARVAFPHVEPVRADTLSDAMTKATPSSLSLLVLAERDESAIVAASQVTDPQGLPHWAVVVLGPAKSELVEVVPPDQWDPRLVGRVFRSALLQHDMLLENLRLRGDLKTVARRINHDIRTPLGCVHTASDLLKNLGPEAVPSVTEILGQSAIEIAQIMTRTSLVLSAAAEPKIPVPVDMGQIVASVLRQLETERNQVGAEVDLPGSWPEANGVSAWLEVIWWNLLSNSLRHGGPSPRIRITWLQEGAEYRFSVSDKGSGVPVDYRAALFSPFDQLHAAQSRGLGLTVVQRLVTLQGGVCSYESPPEGGSRFSFTLPRPAQVAQPIHAG